MWFVITVLFTGLIAGAIAKALVSGPAPKGCLPTTVLGVVGSLVGGFLGYVLFDKDLDEGKLQVSGFFGSIVGAVLVLFVYRARARRS
ncbi:MAG: GlsB/YeaQ/YmgE family stress response membrane protein [Acidimicrobiales bacterium]|nr:GlsB/YeaQ/YmgE family stress response membrane protein [Acidimicrobiales bacterium]